MLAGLARRCPAYAVELPGPVESFVRSQAILPTVPRTPSDALTRIVLKRRRDDAGILDASASSHNAADAQQFRVSGNLVAEYL